ncbi:MAG: fibronectin type III domain-containing protein [Candidatus Sumerlaeota bacterium]|nr:fibronectin type III domain-containing protein [Candidatus Sumerlaeota bacterium]
MNKNRRIPPLFRLDAHFPSAPETLLLLAIAVATLSAGLARAAAPDAPPWADPATVPGDRQMTLNWLPAGGAGVSYCLRYRTSNSSESWTEIANLPASSSSYTVTGLNNFQSYEFEVGAVDAAGATAWNAKRHARPRGPSHPSGLHGGGQVNAIVKAGGGTMVAGGDVGGFQRSLDGGETWFQSSRGIIRAPGSRGVVSLAYHRASGTLYGACGECFYKSTDNGATWALLHSGQDIAVEANSKNYPRRVGKLIAVAPDNINTMCLGTLAGVRKSVDGGATWTALALDGKVVRSLVLDNGFLYAAIEGVGVYRCTTDGSATLFNGRGAPAKPEEILALGGNLYVAANTEGILRLEHPSTAPADAAWTDLGVGSATAKWGAIDGYVSGSDHVIVVGNADPEQLGASGRYTTVMKCANAQAPSGFDWINISSAETTTVKITLAAGNGETYWRVDPDKGEGAPAGWAAQKRLDGNVYGIDQILIDPDNPKKIHVVGQMGIWRTLDGGATWEPSDIGLGTAVHNTVAVDPRHPGTVYVGDTDNGLWVSHDHAESVAYCTRPRSGGKPLIVDVDVDPTTGLVYTAIDDVWVYDPVQRSWSRVAGADGKSLKEAAGGGAPHGVEAENVSGSLVVLAAVEKSGFWRLASGGNWEKASSGPKSVSVGKKGAPLEWPAGGSLVYFGDPGAGVWRSRDAGQNWTLIWDKASGANPTGSLAVTSDITRLFVSTKDGLRRLDHADTADPVGSPGGGAIVVANLDVPNPGALAAQGGTLWVAGEASPSGTADVVLRKSTDGSTFTTFPDDYYEGAAGWPLGLAVEPGFQYTAATSMGTVVSER